MSLLCAPASAQPGLPRGLPGPVFWPGKGQSRAGGGIVGKAAGHLDERGGWRRSWQSGGPDGEPSPAAGAGLTPSPPHAGLVDMTSFSQKTASLSVEEREVDGEETIGTCRMPLEGGGWLPRFHQPVGTSWWEIGPKMVFGSRVPA